MEGDYGIDREVEIFEGDQATGLTFKVQLKAAERRPAAGPSCRIDTDRLDYWNTLDVPVMLVYFIAETGELFGRWTHALGRERPSKAPGRTMTVHFRATDALKDRSDRVLSDVFITRELRAGRIPRPLPVHVYVDGSFSVATPAETVVRLGSWIESTKYADVLQILRSSDAGPAVDISLAEVGGHTVVEAVLPVEVSSLRLVLPGSRYGRNGGLDLLGNDLLVAVAFLLARVGATAVAAELLRGTARRSLLAHLPDLSEFLADVMEEHNLVEEATALVLQLLDEQDAAHRDGGDSYYGVVLRNVGKLSKQGQDELLDHMRRRAELELSCEEPKRGGRAYYNLGQTLNALGRTNEAIAQFELAKIHDPGYEDRDYFFRERGGFLWSLGMYEQAADDYVRSLELGGDPRELLPLLADALLYAGQYGKARLTLEQWSPSGHELDRLAALDLLALDEIDRVTGLTQQSRQPASSSELTRAGYVEPELVALLRTSDALDPRLWSRLLADEASLRRSVLIALVMLNSGVAWAIATAAALDETDEDLGSVVNHVIDSAVRLAHSDEYLQAIEGIAADAEPEFGRRLREVVFERMAAVERPRSRHTTRIIFDSPGADAEGGRGEGST